MLWIAGIAFLGLLIGLFLSKYTKDEIKYGKTYFLVAYKILIFALLILSLFFAWFVYIPTFLLAFLAGIFFSFGLRNLYFYLGLLSILSFWQSSNVFSIMMILIFSIGLVRGALIGDKFKKSKNRIRKLVFSAFFFIIPFILIYFQPIEVNTINIIFAFVSGAIFMEFIRKINL